MLKKEISPGDSLELLDRYTNNELNWFIKELDKQFDEHTIVLNMQKVNDDVMVHGCHTKKGNIQYRQWRNRQIRLLEELKEEDNIFNRLKKSKKSNTVFDKIKFIIKKGK